MQPVTLSSSPSPSRIAHVLPWSVRRRMLAAVALTGILTAGVVAWCFTYTTMTESEQQEFIERESFGVRPRTRSRVSEPSFRTEWIFVPGTGGVRVHTPEYDWTGLLPDPSREIHARAHGMLRAHASSMQALAAYIAMGLWGAFLIALGTVVHLRHFDLTSRAQSPSSLEPPSFRRRATTALAVCFALGYGWWALRWRLWTPAWALLFEGITWLGGSLLFWSARTQVLGRITLGAGAYGLLLLTLGTLPASPLSAWRLLCTIVFAGMCYAMLFRPLVRFALHATQRVHLPSLAQASHSAVEARSRLLTIGSAALAVLAVWSTVRTIESLTTDPDDRSERQWSAHRALEFSDNLLSGHVFLTQAAFVLAAAFWLRSRRRRFSSAAYAVLVAAAGTATLPVWRTVLSGEAPDGAYHVAQLVLGPLSWLALAAALVRATRTPPENCVPPAVPAPRPPIDERQDSVPTP